eukprot:m.154715 g.154715  ORF g.154715 m.154715 type:complete len:51 (+) comp16259_c0_seq6:446-598(+)
MRSQQHYDAGTDWLTLMKMWIAFMQSVQIFLRTACFSQSLHNLSDLPNSK